jgi:hypothetical protein
MKCETGTTCILNVCKANNYCLAVKCSADTLLELKSHFECPAPIEVVEPSAELATSGYYQAKHPRKKKKHPINVGNFFLASFGWFDEIDGVPEGFISFFKSKGSEYFTNSSEDTLIRISDHWGYSIRHCSWHLKGYPKISSWRWKKDHGKTKRIGCVLFKNLTPNQSSVNSGSQIIKEIDKLESRHPF